MPFEDFQDSRHGGHLGHRNGMILAILNLNVAPMPSTKFRLNLVQLNNFSNSESLCRSNASHQGLAEEAN